MNAAGVLRAAIALALGAAVSLGLARFSYALLLPPMRADLGWSYLTAGAMNTANAAGYLVGALLAPRWLSRHDARALLLAGSVGSAAMLAAHGLVRADAALYALRLLTGIASAATFVSGGLMAARLAQQGTRPGLVLGLYYGGTGIGIVVSALLVPPLAAGGWPRAWWALAAAALACTAWMARDTRPLAGTSGAGGPRTAFRWGSMPWALAGYFMFGLGYIGYMTFIVTLLREQRLSDAQVVGFYVVLGLGVVASSWLWAGLLQRQRGGGALALLNALLALATVLPVVTVHVAAAVISGTLFGAVFLSVVASTTALVRHNLPPAQWAAGISAFTIVFAFGQIVGPTVVGWIADGPGGLARGLVFSAIALWVGSALGLRQRALPA